jgi:phage-related protein
MGKFWFNGRSCAEFGIVASGSSTFNAPVRDITMAAVPGRNGDLVIDNGRFKNISVTYPVFIHRDFSNNAMKARAWLRGDAGYKRLEDEYDHDCFRLGVFTGPLDFDMKFLNLAGEAYLTFNCKPQRFLKSGEKTISFAEVGTLHNFTMFEAQPIITVYGSGAGTVSISGCTVEIKAMEDQITLDCELMDAYQKVGEGASQNMNGSIYAPDFPVLVPGENTISWTGGVTAVDIIPRWWTL